MEMIQGSPRVTSECKQKKSCPKSCVPFGTYRVEETNGLIDDSYGDCWVAMGCNADGLNGALKAMMCIQCHITLMRIYMVRSRKV